MIQVRRSQHSYKKFYLALSLIQHQKQLTAGVATAISRSMLTALSISAVAGSPKIHRRLYGRNMHDQEVSGEYNDSLRVSINRQIPLLKHAAPLKTSAKAKRQI